MRGALGVLVVLVGIKMVLPAFDGWGDGDGSVIYALPGVPAEMRRMWEETVSAELKQVAGKNSCLLYTSDAADE